jgi:RHS repeat-associated protein
MADQGIRGLRTLCAYTLVLLASSALHAQQQDKVTYFYTDPQGTVLAEADDKGNIIANYDYTPYGTTALGTPPNGPGYTGHVNDPETNLVYMQHRYYDPVTGHFLSVDPVTPTAANTSNFNRYSYVDDNPIMRIDPDGRTTTCNKTTCTITADTYDPKKSNGQTTIASPQVKAAAQAGKHTVAVHNGPEEKLGFIVKAADGSLTVQNSSDTTTGSTPTAQTAHATIPSGAVALIHGHIDAGPAKSDGMVDNPKATGNYGDTMALAAGIPEATVSQGQVGWHEISGGQLQFSYPAGALTGGQNTRIQANLNQEQYKFQQP